MKLQIHLICLLGLLCFWEMVIQPGRDRHEVLSVEYDVLNQINLSQMEDYSTQLDQMNQMAADDYPSPWAQEYAARSDNAFNCFQDALQALPQLRENDFWQYRTNFFETMRDIVDNAPYAQCDYLLFYQKKDIATATNLLNHDPEIVKKDMPVRMLLAVISAQNYIATKTNYCGEIIFDPFLPCLLPTHLVGYTNQKIEFGIVVAGFRLPKAYFSSPFLLPFRDGTAVLDTTFQKPGLVEIPVTYKFFENRNGHHGQGNDTVRFEVFPK